MKVIAVGENVVDWYFEENEEYLGGNCINFLMQFSNKDPLKLSYVGPIATDQNGKKLLKILHNKDINTRYTSVLEGQTPRAYIKRKETEPLFIQLEKGVLADFILSQEQIEFIQSHDHVHCSIMGGMVPYLEQFKGKGRRSLSFDYSHLQNRKLIEHTSQWVDYIFLSRKEFGEEERALMKAVCGSGGKQAILLLGRDGSVVYDGTNIYKYKEESDIVDSLGAGDAYIAGYMETMLLGGTITLAMESGTKRALEACKYFGGFRESWIGYRSAR